MFFLSLVRIPFFIAPKLSQNNFKNQIVWEVLVGEVLVGEVLVVWEVVGEFVAEVVEVVLVGAVLICWGSGWGVCWGGCWGSAGWDIKYIVSGGKF